MNWLLWAEANTAGDMQLPPQQSTFAAEVDWAYYVVYYISWAIFIPMIAVMCWLCWRFRRVPGVGPQPSPTHSNALELGWTIPTIPIVAVIFYVGVNGFIDMRRMPANALEIECTAQKWSWSFRYPNGGISNELHVPPKRDVVITMRSQDVLHSLFLPNMRTKQDAVPGRYSKLWFHSLFPGESHIFCTEYCGKEHSGMTSKLVVHESTSAYDKAVDDSADWTKSKNPDGSKVTPEQAGKNFYETRGCKTCHSIDGAAGTGPTFKGSWGTSRDVGGPTAGSGKAVFDENYVRESILVPGAKVRAGFQNVMPSYQGQFRDVDIDALAKYLKTLKN